MFEDIEKRENELMKSHTTLHIGGPARWFLLPKDISELESILYESEQSGIETFILGGGSNLLVSDEGYAGAVVSMTKFNQILQIEKDLLQVGAGVSLFALNSYCYNNSLTGLEWSYGIPGSVGGACKMNAGAYGGEFCNYLKEICVFDGFRVKKRHHLSFSYRKGCLKKGEILLFATLKLSTSQKEDVLQKQKDFLNKRKASQPYGEFSLGSVFKRGKGFIPAKLIEEFGYKGAIRGGVSVSKKHAGFLVNNGQGSSTDFLTIVKSIDSYAKDKGYSFEREFVHIGE